jgi:hypothetical protein
VGFIWISLPELTVVDIFHARRALQSAVAQVPLQRPVLPPVPLAVNEQAQRHFEAQAVDVSVLLLLLVRIPGQPEHDSGLKANTIPG